MCRLVRERPGKAIDVVEDVADNGVHEIVDQRSFACTPTALVPEAAAHLLPEGLPVASALGACSSFANAFRDACKETSADESAPKEGAEDGEDGGPQPDAAPSHDLAGEESTFPVQAWEPDELEDAVHVECPSHVLISEHVGPEHLDHVHRWAQALDESVVD